jgi:ATP-dependent RNA helicase DeaD
MGYEEASPIQSQAIPALLAGSDVVGQSQTGSGKTAAFALPAIEKIDPALRQTQVLILCPTRELAVQVAEEVAKLASFKKGVRELPIYGGQSYERQFRGLQQGAHIVIGTPGRVMDHLERKTLDLSGLKMVILDEADRMLDMGFLEDIRTVLSQAPPERQTVFFSATMPRPIQDLIKTFTQNPVSVRIEAQAMTTPSIDQVYYEVDRRSKLDVLCRLIDIQDIKFGIIFCATKLMVDELTEHLSARGYAADKMHGDMTQGLREKVIGKFRKRAIEFLIATDVAARGLDVDDIEVVFNYDLPHDGEDYVHRIGRTGRAGRSGRAITFVAGREIYKMQNIMRFTKGKIRRERVPTESEVEEKKANAFLESLQTTLEQGTYKRQDTLIERLLDQNHSPTDIASAVIHLYTEMTAKPAVPTAEPDKFPSRPRHDDRPSHSGRSERPERRERAGKTERSERPLRGEREGARFEPRAPRTERGSEFKPFEKKPAEGTFVPKPRKEVAPPAAGMVRIVLGVGSDHGARPGDILGVITEAAQVPGNAVGTIQLKGKQAVVEVKKENADQIVQQLTGFKFKSRMLWCKKC